MRSNQSLVHVFFSDYISTRYRRDLFQSWMQIIAMFGGLTGLFVGFSLVSIYEIGKYSIFSLHIEYSLPNLFSLCVFHKEIFRFAGKEKHIKTELNVCNGYLLQKCCARLLCVNAVQQSSMWYRKS